MDYTRIRVMTLPVSSRALHVALVVKNPPASVGGRRDVGLIPWRRARQPTPAFLPGESHGQKSLAGYSPWGRNDPDMTEVTWHTRLPSSGSGTQWERVQTHRRRGSGCRVSHPP